MKKSLTFVTFFAALFFGVFLLTGCLEPSKLITNGDYDGALRLCIRNLHDMKREKDVVALEAAFNKGQQRDLERITFLKKEGQPASWEEITQLYNNIKTRQALAAAVMPLSVKSQGNRVIKLNTVEVDDELIGSQKNAAATMYARAEGLLKQVKTTGDRLPARQAYTELTKIDRYFRDYKDKETMKAQALDLGTCRVFVKMINSSNTIMPDAFERELLKLPMAELNSPWIQYTTQKVAGVTYDYDVIANIKLVDVSPEQNNTRNYIDEKTIQDGFEYVLDARGNVLKDSLGNDRKRPKMVAIRADVQEVRQYKQARVSGTLDFYNLRTATHEQVKTLPVASDATFENFAATFTGDRRALTPESTTKLGNVPRPFPTNPQLLSTAGERLKPLIKQAILDNRNLLVGTLP